MVSRLFGMPHAFVLRCPHCPRIIVLPPHSALGNYGDPKFMPHTYYPLEVEGKLTYKIPAELAHEQHVWPMDFACFDCEHLSQHSMDEARQAEVISGPDYERLRQHYSLMSLWQVGKKERGYAEAKIFTVARTDSADDRVKEKVRRISELAGASTVVIGRPYVPAEVHVIGKFALFT